MAEGIDQRRNNQRILPRSGQNDTKTNLIPHTPWHVSPAWVVWRKASTGFVSYRPLRPLTTTKFICRRIMWCRLRGKESYSCADATSLDKAARSSQNPGWCACHWPLSIKLVSKFSPLFINWQYFLSHRPRRHVTSPYYYNRRQPVESHKEERTLLAFSKIIVNHEETTYGDLDARMGARVHYSSVMSTHGLRHGPIGGEWNFQMSLFVRVGRYKRRNEKEKDKAEECYRRGAYMKVCWTKL